MNTLNTTALVIDCRARTLVTFVASVTEAQEGNTSQLVLRHALDLGKFDTLLASSEAEVYEGGGVTRTRRVFRAEMPVILMGQYSARSSAGHVTVVAPGRFGYGGDEASDGHRQVTVVGGLGGPLSKKGLRVLGVPISATLVRGPVVIAELPGAGNSNCASADAAMAGVRLLANTDRKSVFLAEGQSDTTYVVRLRSAGETGTETRFPTEHRSEMFARASIIRRMLSGQEYRSRVRGSSSGAAPTEEQVQAGVKFRLERYCAFRKEGAQEPWRQLGRGFEYLNGLDEAATELLAELSAGESAESETTPRAESVGSNPDDFVEVE